MTKRFTLEYWKDDDWYVGRLTEVPGVFSQGESLEELERNIQEAYELMIDEQETPSHLFQSSQWESCSCAKTR